jgi:hypothetical protein
MRPRGKCGCPLHSRTTAIGSPHPERATDLAKVEPPVRRYLILVTLHLFQQGVQAVVERLKATGRLDLDGGSSERHRRLFE